MMRSKQSCLSFLLLTLVFVSGLSADWVYFPYEYNQIYKEKYALELELADIRKQHQNELNRLEEEKKELQTQNRNLTEDLELEKRNRAKEQDEYSDRMRDNDMRLRSLEKKGHRQRTPACG